MRVSFGVGASDLALRKSSEELRGSALEGAIWVLQDQTRNVARLYVAELIQDFF
jgi:hypothetical protein